MTASSTPPGGPVRPAPPTWLRGLEIFTGLLAIVLAGLALADIGIALTLLVFFFAIALLFIGLQRLARAYAHPGHPDWHRGLDGVIGIVAVVAAFVVLVLPGVALLSLVLLLYFALLLIGIGWLTFAFVRSGEPGWYRALAVVFGGVALVAAFVALVDLRAAVLTLVLLLAFVLLLTGIGDLISGVTGRPYQSLLPWPVPGVSPPGFPPFGPGGAGPPPPPPPAGPPPG